jgi:hypothetical protein
MRVLVYKSRDWIANLRKAFVKKENPNNRNTRCVWLYTITNSVAHLLKFTPTNAVPQIEEMPNFFGCLVNLYILDAMISVFVTTTPWAVATTNGNVPLFFLMGSCYKQ